jgi:hypothetical protein
MNLLEKILFGDDVRIQVWVPANKLWIEHGTSRSVNRALRRVSREIFGRDKASNWRILSPKGYIYIRSSHL